MVETNWKDPKSVRQYMKQWRDEHTEHLSNYFKNYNTKHNTRLKLKSRKYHWINRETQKKKKKLFYEQNKTRILKSMNQKYHNTKTQLRKKVLAHYSYGTIKCRCCNYSGESFLTVDHIFGRHTERKKLTGLSLIKWLIGNNYPDGYQILCWNCNCTKGFFGQCCHKFKWEPTSKIKRIKLEFLKAYSGGQPKCACCGECNIGFLTIDHINGHRPPEEKGLTSSLLYYYLKKKGFPSGYQVLCYNCNCAKGNNKECPHKIDTNINKC